MKHNLIYLIKLKNIIAVLICFVTGFSLYSQSEKQLVIGQQPVYKVSRARSPITVDGKMDEASWKNADVQTFNYFYRGDRPVEKQNSKFRMLWDHENLYLFYECEDTSLTARETNFDARQDRNYVDDRFRSTSTLFPIYNIRLDVHQPASFGLMEFIDN